MNTIKSVFVIEDDARNLLVVSALLDRMAVDYRRNTSGARAVQQVHNMQPRPKMILLDMDLPQADPFGIYDELQAEPELCYIPVIAMAGDERLREVQGQIAARKFAGVMTKPVPENQFFQMVNRFLNNRDD